MVELWVLIIVRSGFSSRRPETLTLDAFVTSSRIADPLFPSMAPVQLIVTSSPPASRKMALLGDHLNSVVDTFSVPSTRKVQPWHADKSMDAPIR
jgi:hypothetical protein